MEPLELFERSLTAPLDELVVPSVQVMPPAAVQTWQVPDTDIEAYQRWGLPADSQARFEPVFDAVVEDSDQVHYRVVALLNDDILTAAGSGAVEGFSRLETATAPRYWVNGSGALFVDAAWRWHAMSNALRAKEFEVEDYDRLDRFFEMVRANDPTVGEDSYWHGAVEGW